MTCKPTTLTKFFSLINIEKIPSDVKGVYGFWCRDMCLYIGKAEEQPLRDRLLTHFNGTHNPDLRLWIQTYPKEIEFAYKQILETSTIHSVERLMIERYNPRTNKTK